MSFSVGAMMAGFLTTRLFGEKSAVAGIIVLSITAACMYLFMAVNTVLVLFFAANFIIGACNAAIRIQRITYLFHHIPNHVIGRANSIFFVINVFFRVCLIGVLTLPLFHEGRNIIYPLVIMAAICCAGSVVMVFQYKKLKRQPAIE